MAERNAIKVRLCSHCNEGIKGKASALMRHYKECKLTKTAQEEELARAAEKAIMDKMSQQWESNLETENDQTSN